MTNLTQAQAQLKELWDNAEQAAPQEGDAFIAYFGEGETQYSIGVARWELNPARYRILERAKPKAPEWEAVVASHIEDEEHRRQVFARNDWGEWESATQYATTDELVDPVPLVEMPEREALADALEKPYYAQGGWSWPGSYPLVDAVLELLRGER